MPHSAKTHLADRLAASVRAHRERLRLTQQAIADAAHLDPATVSAVEGGRHKAADCETVVALAGALGVHPGDLIASTPEPTP